MISFSGFISYIFILYLISRLLAWAFSITIAKVFKCKFEISSVGFFSLNGILFSSSSQALQLKLDSISLQFGFLRDRSLNSKLFCVKLDGLRVTLNGPFRKSTSVQSHKNVGEQNVITPGKELVMSILNYMMHLGFKLIEFKIVNMQIMVNTPAGISLKLIHQELKVVPSVPAGSNFLVNVVMVKTNCSILRTLQTTGERMCFCKLEELTVSVVINLLRLKARLVSVDLGIDAVKLDFSFGSMRLFKKLGKSLTSKEQNVVNHSQEKQKETQQPPKWLGLIPKKFKVAVKECNLSFEPSAEIDAIQLKFKELEFNRKFGSDDSLDNTSLSKIDWEFSNSAATLMYEDRTPIIKCGKLKFEGGVHWNSVQYGPVFDVQLGIKNPNIAVYPFIFRWGKLVHATIQSGTKKELIIQTPKPVSKSSSFLSKIYLNACVVASDASLVVQTDSNEELSKISIGEGEFSFNVKHTNILNTKQIVETYSCKFVGQRVTVNITEDAERVIHNEHFGKLAEVNRISFETDLNAKTIEKPKEIVGISSSITVWLSTAFSRSLKQMISQFSDIIKKGTTVTPITPPTTPTAPDDLDSISPPTPNAIRIRGCADKFNLYFLDEQSMFYLNGTANTLDWNFPLRALSLCLHNCDCGIKTKLDNNNVKKFPYFTVRKLGITTIGKSSFETTKFEVITAKYYWSIPFKLRFEKLKTSAKSMFNSLKPKQTSQQSSRKKISSTVAIIKNLEWINEYTQQVNLVYTIKDCLRQARGNRIVYTFTDATINISGEQVATIESGMVLFDRPDKGLFARYHEAFLEVYNSAVLHSSKKLYTNLRPESRIMIIDLTRLHFSFPYNTNFGASLSKVLLARKAMQELIKQAQFPAGPQLPHRRTFVKLRNPQFEIKDNPIEIALGIHQQIWHTEYQQREQREELLQQKIKELNISADKMEAMKAELERQNGQIYKERISYFIKNNTRPKELFTAKADYLEFEMYRYESIQTDRGILKKVMDLDDTPLKKDANGNYIPLRTVWATGISGRVSNGSAWIKNFPLPIVTTDNASASGTIIMAKYPPTKNDTLLRKLDIGFEREEEIEYSMAPSYLWYEFTGNAEGNSVSWGPGYMPSIKDINIQLSRITLPSLDPSPRKMFWDKMRHRLHGRFTANLKDTTVRAIVGLNVYDPTDNLEAHFSKAKVQYKTEVIEISSEHATVKQNPCISYLPTVVEIPFVRANINWTWNCKQDPRAHFFEINLPEQYKTEEGLRKGGIPFDSYEKWRATGLNCSISVSLLPQSSNSCSVSSPTLVMDPVSLSWFIKFLNFYLYQPWQIRFGQEVKFGIPRKPSIGITALIKSLKLDIKAEQPEIVWSNGLESNMILQANCQNFDLFIYFYRERLPIPRIGKKRIRSPLLPIGVRIKTNNIRAYLHSYDKERKEPTTPQFGEDFMLQISKIIFRKDIPKELNILGDAMPTEKFDEKVERAMDAYKSKLVVEDMQFLWSSKIRDAVFIWVDIAQQFIFHQLEIINSRFLNMLEKDKNKLNQIGTQQDKPKSPPPVKKSGTELLMSLLNYPTNVIQKGKPADDSKGEIFSKSFIAVILKPQVILYSSSCDECFVLSAKNCNVEVREMVNNHGTNHYSEILTLIDDMEGTAASTDCKIDDLWNNNSKQAVRIMEPSPWVIRYSNGKSTKNGPQRMLSIEVPNVELAFSSSHLRTLLSIITNVLIPKKRVRKVVLEDHINACIYSSKLKPEEWKDVELVKKKCVQIRINIRQLESYLDSMRRQAVKNPDEKLLSEMRSTEQRIEQLKMFYRGMKETLQKNVAAALEKQQTKQPDVVANFTFFTCKWKMLDPNGKVFMEAILTLFRGTITKNNDYSMHYDITFHQFTGKNRLPNPIYEDMILPYGERDVIGDDDTMLRITAHKLPPVGGIRRYEHFEIELAPLHIQLTYDAYRHLWRYFFPLSKRTTAYIQPDPPNQQASSLMVGNQETTPSKDNKKSSAKDNKKTPAKENKKKPTKTIDKNVKNYTAPMDVDVMKYRANNAIVFNYVKIHGVRVFLSLKGVPEESGKKFMKYMKNFEKVKIKIMPITYNGKLWTWYNLADTLKRDVIKQGLSYVLPITVKSVIATKSALGRKLKQVAKTPTEALSSPFKLVHQMKYTQHIDNLKKSLTSNTGDTDSLKQMLLFGGKKVDDKDLGKKLFGKKYTKSDTIPLPAEKEIMTTEIEGTLTEELFDQLRSESAEAASSTEEESEEENTTSESK